MKRIPLFSFTALLIVVLITFFISSCQKEVQSASSGDTNAIAKASNEASMNAAGTNAPVKLDLLHVPLFIEDADHQMPVGDNTLLWNISGHVPITAPDGHQITLGEFNNVSGYAEVKCVDAGTHVVMHLKGLIPNGVYTIWVVTFQAPGFNGMFNPPGSQATLINQIGEGALGAPDGSQNSFTASADGTASLSAILPGGPLGEFGSVGNCVSSEYEVHFIAAYHLDNQTHGSSPGEDHTTWTIQFGFPVMGSRL